MLVDLRPRAQLALKFVHVPYDAHDPRSLALFLTNLDLVANRISSGEETPCELCADNSDKRRVPIVRIQKDRGPSSMESASCGNIRTLRQSNRPMDAADPVGAPRRLR